MDVHDQRTMGIAALRQLAEILPEPALVMASDGTIVSVNASARRRLGSTDARDPSYAAVAQQLAPLVAQAHRFSQPHRDTIELPGPPRVTLLAEVLPVDAASPSPSWLVRLHDTPSPSNSSVSPARADRYQREFLAMLGHELRNPLSSMATAVALLREQEPASGDSSQWLRVVDQKLTLVRRLVDDLLHLARVTRGHIELRPARVDLGQLVDEQLAADPREEPSLNWQRPEQAIPVRVDVDRLHQVLDNLLHNARKFTPRHGSITVSVDANDGEARIVVRDTGSGIAPDTLPHVFDLFTQDTQPLDRARGGLGIGLTLVRAIVEAHGGYVTARSEGTNRGSEFEVRLPLAASSPLLVAAPAQSSMYDSAANEGLDIVVVDDDIDSASLLATLLNQWGHHTRVEHDGASAITAISAKAPDLVLLDIGLPGIDGFQVAQRLRRDQPVDSPPYKLVALTGYGQDADERRARAAGFDEFMVKPVQIPRLKRLLDELCVAGTNTRAG